MSKEEVKKYLYGFVHIMMPMTYFVLSMIWGHLFTTKTFWEHLTDTLGILAIWYLFSSLVWFFSMSYLDKQAEKISNEIETKQKI